MEGKDHLLSAHPLPNMQPISAALRPIFRIGVSSVPGSCPHSPLGIGSDCGLFFSHPSPPTCSGLALYEQNKKMVQIKELFRSEQSHQARSDSVATASWGRDGCGGCF